MKSYFRRIFFILYAMAITLYAFTSGVEAGDNNERVGPGYQIYHQLWAVETLPLKWFLHQDGVINNNSTGTGAPTVTNEEAQEQISAALKEWVDVSTSNISVDYLGETTTGECGCDFINVATWADPPTSLYGMPPPYAKGVVTAYVGSERILNQYNRTVNGCGTLPEDIYPDGFILIPGTILDADLAFNSDDFDWVTTPNSTFEMVDIHSITTHEFGHLLCLSHTSFYTTEWPTMIPLYVSQDVNSELEYRTLELDDQASSGSGYPDVGFWPGGSPPFSTGAISGRVTDPSGAGVEGVRVWAYGSSGRVVYETFTATGMDWDPSLQSGDYVLKGLVPGEYRICILPWGHGVPNWFLDNITRYNETVRHASQESFSTECYDDIASSTTAPDQISRDLARKIKVNTGQTTPNIDFVTGAQNSDFILVMDRSGSMSLPATDPKNSKTKFEALQDAAHAFIDYLDLSGDHRLGLVQFNESIIPFAQAVDLQDLNATGIKNAHAGIDSMTAGGFTNIIAGLESGIDQLTSIPSPNPRQIILLFSDGQHNRPFGSDLNDIHDPILDNDITLYSVGYGLNTDSSILDPIAVDTGGLHVDEQDIDPVDLRKHFLSIAASALDETTLSDPRYSLAFKESAKLKVRVTPDERNLTFVVNWLTRDPDRVDVKVYTPGGCCISSQKPGKGYDVRSGDTHRIVRIPLPFKCGDQQESQGTWSIKAIQLKKTEIPEDVDIFVFASSPTRLVVGIAKSKFGRVVKARLLRNGRVLIAGSVKGELLAPLKPTNDSEVQDAAGIEYNPPYTPTTPKEQRLVRFPLNDDGKDGDAKPNDGVFTGLVPPVYEQGMCHVRIVARFGEKNKLVRDQWTSFHQDGK